MYKGRLFLERIKDSKIVKSYYYEQLVSDFEEKKKLKTKYLDSGHYRLYCGCNREKEMKIDKDFKRIYPASNSIKHRKGCPRNNNSDIHNKVWSVNEQTGEVLATINFSLEPNKQRYNSNNQHNRALTISTLIKKINYQTSQRQISNKQSFSDKFDFWKTLCYRDTNLITLSSAALVNGKKTKNLRKMLFEPYKVNTIKDYESRFVYMYLSDFKDLKNGNIELTCIYKNSKNNIAYYRFIVKQDKFYKALKASKLDINNIFETDIIVSGFVFRNKFNRMELFEVALVRCNKYGLFAENTTEAEFHNL